MYTIRLVCCLCAVTCLSAMMGCGSSSIIPPVDPAAATDAAMAQYDKNGDDLIDQEEMAASPALMAGLAEIDTNGDKKISRAELAHRVENMYARGIGLLSVDCLVTLKKKTLVGANIRFIPEAFLGEGTTKEAHGVTGPDGHAKMAIPSDLLPEDVRKYKMMQVGYYRVEITHPSIQLPVRFNTNTELGFEVHPDSHERNQASFEVVKK